MLLALLCDAAAGLCLAGDCSAADAERDMPHCAARNARCQCVRCNPGHWSSDCSRACSDPTVSVMADILVVAALFWLFLAYLYYNYRVTEEDDMACEPQHDATPEDDGSAAARAAREDATEVATRSAEVASTHAGQATIRAMRRHARTLQRQARTLQRLLVSHMQIVSTILASIRWSPEVPQLLRDMMHALRIIFTVNVPGFLSSPDCAGGGGEPMAPMAKWYLALIVPVCTAVLIGAWYSLVGRCMVVLYSFARRRR